MNTPLLSVRVHEKRHQARPVLRDISFEVTSGEIVALLGASGCGKSTLLRLIAGLDADFTGDIVHSAEHDIGFVFQEPRLMPWLSVANNVGFPLGHHQGRNQRVLELLNDVGLAHAVDYFPKQLSGGMAQRVAIARALVTSPRILLLDEPFSALDVLTRGRLHRLLRDLIGKYQVGTIFVTHDPDEAISLASRILVLGDTPGQIQAEFRVPESVTAAKRGELHEQILGALETSTRQEPC